LEYKQKKFIPFWGNVGHHGQSWQFL